MAGPDVVKCRECKQEIEFAITYGTLRRVPIRPSRFEVEVATDPRAHHAGLEHPVTGRLMIRHLQPTDHLAPDEHMVLAHRYECPTSSAYIPPSAPLAPAATAA